MSLKKILTCAAILSILATTPCIVNAADYDDTNKTIDRTEQRTGQRKLASYGNAKYQPTRFIKLTMDDRYTYYLDRDSIMWKRLPYSSSEYMADVWIRMIENNPEEDPDERYQNVYFSVDDIEEVQAAREKNIRYAPTDLEVLKHKHYFLEHYYLRPQKKQIQFLCELEVIGHPQNTDAGRPYEYKNWEELVPGSIESAIYKNVIKEIGTEKAYERGHMKVTDWFEEITRISIH